MDLKRRDHDGQPLLDLADVADMNEILIVRAENQRRAQRHAERQAKARASKGGKRG